MSWLRQAGRRWLQSVDEEPKLSTPFDFRKYLLFSPRYIAFYEKTRLLSNLARTPCIEWKWMEIMKWEQFVKMLWIGLDLGEGHQPKTI